jgi:hypothetical protein
VKSGARLLQQMNAAKAGSIPLACASINEDTVVADPPSGINGSSHQIDLSGQDLPLLKIGDVTVEPLNDPSCGLSVDEKSQQQSSGQQPIRNLAQQAAGFLPSDSNATEKVNMAAVLSGMGFQ